MLGWVFIILGIVWSSVMASELDPRGTFNGLNVRLIWANPACVRAATWLWMGLLVTGNLLLCTHSAASVLAGVGLSAFGLKVVRPWLCNWFLRFNEPYQLMELQVRMVEEIRSHQGIYAQAIGHLVGVGKLTGAETYATKSSKDLAIEALERKKDLLCLTSEDISFAIECHWGDSDESIFNVCKMLAVTAYEAGTRVLN